jgi:hypothetical protein
MTFGCVPSIVFGQEFYAEKHQRVAIHESGHVVIARYLQLPAVFEKVSSEGVQSALGIVVLVQHNAVSAR